MNTENQLIINLDKRKVFLLLIGCIAFVGLGFLMILSPEYFESKRLGNPRITLFIIGGILIVFFSPFLLSILLKLFDNKPGLIISNDGICDNSGGAPIGFVEWGDVNKITSIGINKQMIILIHVNNPNRYIERETNSFKRFIKKNNYKHFKTPVQITCNSLNYNGTQLLTLLNDKLTLLKKETNAR